MQEFEETKQEKIVRIVALANVIAIVVAYIVIVVKVLYN